VAPESVADLDFADMYPVWERYWHLCKEAKKLNAEDGIFEFPFSRASPPRMREVTVHMATESSEVLQLRCTAGATCAELLEAVRETGRKLPSDAQVHRLPPLTQATGREQERWFRKVVHWVSPVAPPARQLLKPDHLLSEEHRDIVNRVRVAMARRDRVGLRTLDVWITPPSTK